MDFSIVVPMYNSSSYICDCIESILNQTYKNYELLLIDDGSTDNTFLQIEEYINECPEQIKYVKKENGGAASARNVGIDVAEGEHIVFIDADDTVACDYLGKNI